MIRRRLIVTGREGQIARSLANTVDFDVIALGRPQLDLLRPAELHSLLAEARPDVIVSAAAYTAVDMAENEPDIAYAVNGVGPAVLGNVSAALNVPIIHLSTDYVFDGFGAVPYSEEDVPAPINVYGRSKLLGEQMLTKATDNYAILRTAWVYSVYGKNFVRTMLNAARTRDTLSVVADQCGSPSNARDLATGILKVASNLVGNEDPSLRGVFNMSGAGEATWAEFATEIFAYSRAAGGPSAFVTPIASADYPTSARRPNNSRLNTAKIDRIHGVRLPDWRESLRECVGEIIQS